MSFILTLLTDRAGKRKTRIRGGRMRVLIVERRHIEIEIGDNLFLKKNFQILLFFLLIINIIKKYKFWFLLKLKKFTAN